MDDGLFQQVLTEMADQQSDFARSALVVSFLASSASIWPFVPRSGQRCASIHGMA